MLKVLCRRSRLRWVAHRQSERSSEAFSPIITGLGRVKRAAIGGFTAISAFLAVVTIPVIRGVVLVRTATKQKDVLHCDFDRSRQRSRRDRASVQGGVILSLPTALTPIHVIGSCTRSERFLLPPIDLEKSESPKAVRDASRRVHARGRLTGLADQSSLIYRYLGIKLLEIGNENSGDRDSDSSVCYAGVRRGCDRCESHLACGRIRQRLPCELRQPE
jgi:hypothetical protein